MFGTQQLVVFAIVLSALVTAGCEGRVLVAGNMVVTLIPCVLLWVTVNLKKSR